VNGKRRGPAGTDPLIELAGADDIDTLSHAPDTIPLRQGLHAVYVRDPDPGSVAARKLRRGRKLNEEQAKAYRAWLAERLEDAS